MRKWIAAAAFAVLAAPSLASNTPVPYFTGTGGSNPIDLPGAQIDLNNLIQQINLILTPLQPNVPGATNFISLTPGTPGGTSPTIGISGTSANASIRIQPAGTGNIILFPGSNSTSTGLLKVGNSPSWVPMQGIAACPGVPAGRAPIGMADHVTGYLVMLDWLDRKHGVVAC